MKFQLRWFLLTAIGTVICAWSAALLCIIFHGRSSGGIVPLGFLAIVILAAVRCGAAAGIMGSAVSALIFACFLYQPLGTVSVQDPAARVNLAWLVVGGLACSYLLAPRRPGPQGHE